MKNILEIIKFGVNKYFKFTYPYIILLTVLLVILIILEIERVRGV